MSFSSKSLGAVKYSSSEDFPSESSPSSLLSFPESDSSFAESVSLPSEACSTANFF